MLFRFYTLLLRLYPRQFQQDFAAEMQTVFGDALGSARREGGWALLKLCGREARQLPRALVREHLGAFKARKEADMGKRLGLMAGEAGPGREETPTRSWRGIFLAILPFLLLLLWEAVPTLLVQMGLLAWDTPAMKALNTILAGLSVIIILTIFLLAWHRKWPLWSATWVLVFLAPLLSLVGALLGWLYRQRPDFLINNLFIYFAGPLILAVLLYGAGRRDPRRGLLAVLPLLCLLWRSDLEFVPEPLHVAVQVSGLALFGLAAAFVLWWGRWRGGLAAVLATNLAVGALASYAGIYHGGMLPSSAIGPSPAEVARALIPSYLATCAILIGPLFAWKIRRYGRSAGQAGRIGYHLALAGLLLVILANMVALMMGTEDDTIITPANRSILIASIILGLGIYLLSLIYLFRIAPISLALTGLASNLLLLLLPLAIPLAFMLPFISWKEAVSILYGTPLLWEIPQDVSLSAGLVWLALSVWVVMQETGLTRPAAPVGEAYETAR